METKVKSNKGRKALTDEQIQSRIHLINHSIDSFGEVKDVDLDQVDAIKKQYLSILERYQTRLQNGTPKS